MITAGFVDGTIMMFDIRSGRSRGNAWDAHAGSVTQVALRGNYLVTCGLTDKVMSIMETQRLRKLGITSEMFM